MILFLVFLQDCHGAFLPPIIHCSVVILITQTVKSHWVRFHWKFKQPFQLSSPNCSGAHTGPTLPAVTTVTGVEMLSFSWRHSAHSETLLCLTQL